jgi:endonuclease YncB( thermonuclease family)
MANLASRHFLALFVIAPLFQITGLAAADIAGPAKVIDGDTIVIHSVKIRLHGIDAPEGAQVCKANGKPYRCGTSATLALARRIGGKPVSCEKRDQDQYGRIVAVCHASGEDLNSWLISEGLALAYRRYSTDYIDQEQTARDARRGLWRGEFVAPWHWRKGKRMAGARAAEAAPGSCRIKGNINRQGKKIYHLLGGRYYAPTRIDEGKGERWFCAEEDAKEAGWRKSQR